MQPEPNPPSPNSPAPFGNAATPPPLLPPPGPERKSTSGGSGLSLFLSLGLALFLADAFVSLADDSLIAFFNVHALAGLRGLVSFLMMVMAFVIYVLMAFLPSIPKRLFFPLSILPLAVILGVLPFAIYAYDQLRWVAWGFSLVQVLFGLGALWWVQGGWECRWPLVPETWLGAPGFRWRSFLSFVLVTLLVLIPATIVYVSVCAGLAVDHFSDGFLALRPAGLKVRVKQYVRSDGKTIQLIPMIHIGDSQFYEKLSASFPTNSITLMEGVTDEKQLLTNTISYKAVASQLGLSEQQKVFKPQGKVMRADVDIEEFSTNTINLLNLVMRFHAKGRMDPGSLAALMQSPPPGFEKELFDDLLRKRNRHLLGEIQSRLPDSESIMIPWGAAHMPEIAREIGKLGFRIAETQEYVAIRFGGSAKSGTDAKNAKGSKRIRK